MKILVVPRHFIEKELKNNHNWISGKWIISIFSHEDFSPLPDRYSILKLEFDDVTEKDIGGWSNLPDKCIFFNQNHALKIHNFIKDIENCVNHANEMYVHCDAGVSRSGAVGYMLNEWFNKFIKKNREDNEFFIQNNHHIMPNPLVVRILKQEFFGNDYSGVFVNDYEYNADRKRIDHISLI